jgi:hypothetical protein
VQGIVRTPIRIFSLASLLSDTINYAGVAQSRPAHRQAARPIDFRLLCLGCRTWKNAPRCNR